MTMHSPTSPRPFVPGLWHGRPTTPEQSDQTDEYDSDEGYGYDSEQDNELYEPEDRGFRIDDKVWIRLRRTWYNGRVKKIDTPDRTKDGRYRYHVYFQRKKGNTNMRVACDPLEGTIKPDNLYIRQLLIAYRCRIGSPWDAL